MALSAQHKTRQRRGQRGVAATELALGLPILVLVAVGAFAMARIGMTKIRLEGWTNQAAQKCALQVENPALATGCVQEFLGNAPLKACGEPISDALQVEATFEEFETPFVDPETGENRVRIVPTLKARVTCEVTPIRGASFITRTSLTATAVASRN